MQRITTLAVLFFPALIAADNFEFTAPSTGTSLNLSAPIKIEWNEGTETQYAQVDISWSGQTVKGGGFTYSLAENVAITDRQYTWDPKNVSEALQSTNLTLSSGKDFTFEAKLHNANETRGGGTDSDGYSVTGYPEIGNAATAVHPHMAVAAVAGLLSLALCYL
ncbi:hypothetical protein SUNI508_10379 [Seiridium unicorne]|uniref:Ser-Thr-rich glycosyl-phosphatidyl-inositol-anchored membrane family-domain-containing protein n=1 Tax=Seiridium unicorne TaxID=138068 RepID=A0ABR2ULZ1_9PEZI